MGCAIISFMLSVILENGWGTPYDMIPQILVSGIVTIRYLVTKRWVIGWQVSCVIDTKNIIWGVSGICISIICLMFLGFNLGQALWLVRLSLLVVSFCSGILVFRYGKS